MRGGDGRTTGGGVSLSDVLIQQHQKVSEIRQGALRPMAQKLLGALESGAEDAVVRGFLDEIPEGEVLDGGKYPYNMVADAVVRRRLATLMDLPIGERIAMAYVVREFSRGGGA